LIHGTNVINRLKTAIGACFGAFLFYLVIDTKKAPKAATDKAFRVVLAYLLKWTLNDI
jgi:hypothetical protein